MYTNIQHALNPAYLGLILFPTEKCNFRCTYCYEEYTLGKMSNNTVQAIKKLLTNRAHDLNIININWFGGEPLLTKDIVIDILSHVKQIQHTQKEFSLLSSMTTNGYLLDEETMISLSDLGVQGYQISLDGHRAYHNVKRFIHHPDRSFDRIWKNILCFNHLRQKGTIKEGKILLRLHIHPDNQTSLLQLAHDINAYLDPQFFDIFFKNIAHLGGKNDAEFDTLAEGSDQSTQRIQELSNLLSHFQHVHPHRDGSSYMCYAAMPNSFAIRSDGSLAKCTVALNNPKNHLGYLTPEGTFSFEEGKSLPWIQSLQTLDKEILACPLSYVEKT